jgi:O-antigen ligase
MFAAHPWLGVGPDNFRLLYGGYAGLERADTRTHSNNMYLEVLAGGGLLAAAAFLWFMREAVAVFIAAGRGRRPEQLALVAAGLAIAFHAVVDSFIIFAPTYILFSLTLGLAAAVARGLEPAADAHRI